jgi:RNA polymerase sigma-70 factor (ECF subfamily)
LDFGDIEQRCGTEIARERSPEEVFDRQWALTLLDRVRELLKSEFAASGKTQRFDALMPLFDGDTSASTRDVASRLGMTENAVMVAVHRLRERFRQLLRDEIAQTVSTEAEIDDEIRDLFRALGGSPRSFISG